jgi:DNA-binding beta-propeller fold protein YncE
MSAFDQKSGVTSTVTMSLRLLVLLLLALVGSVLQFISTARGDDPQQITFVREWGRRGNEPGEFDFPIAIAISKVDEVFVSDHLNYRVQKFDGNGELLGHFAVLPNPGGIALDAAGNIYLTHIHASGQSKDDAGDFVSVYDPDGTLLRRWGQSGTAAGEFDCPGGIAVAKDGRVYVADQTNHRIQVFDQTGMFLLQWGEYGNEPGQFGGKGGPKSRVGGPQFVAFDSAGNVWTTEGANCRVQKFTADGELLSFWGSAEDRPGGFGGEFTGFGKGKAGSLVGPIALCFDRQDRLWISTASGRVQQFAQDGSFLGGLLNEQGTGPGQFFAPHGVAVDSAGCLYVVDAYNHRVQKFEVGQ